MNKKTVINAAVAAALACSAVSVSAAVVGVPGEALLVPLVLNDTESQGTGGLNTYVQIRVPATLGQDFVMHTYTTPNVNPAPFTGVVSQGAYGDLLQIHWVAYDYESEIIVSGFCDASPGDSVLWTTDPDLRDLQDDDDQINVGPIRSRCGPSSGLSRRIGYVVFETATAARGWEADFAMEGAAWITDPIVASPVGAPALLSVPVMPMADGEDPPTATKDTPPQLGANEVLIPKRTTAPDEGQAQDPVVVAPLAAGIRMNNGDDDGTDPVVLAAGVQGNYASQGLSLHAFWFDRNDEDREARTLLIWDEHEETCNQTLELPHEVNLWVYNLALNIPEDSDADPWSDVADTGSVENRALTDLVGAINAAESGDAYVSGTGTINQYCEPPNWDETVMGYAEYSIEEQGDDDGRVSAAAVAFEAQADNFNADAWARHMMTARGFH